MPALLSDDTLVAHSIAQDAGNSNRRDAINEIDLMPVTAVRRSTTDGHITMQSGLSDSSIPQTGANINPTQADSQAHGESRRAASRPMWLIARQRAAAVHRQHQPDAAGARCGPDRDQRPSIRRCRTVCRWSTGATTIIRSNGDRTAERQGRPLRLLPEGPLAYALKNKERRNETPPQLSKGKNRQKEKVLISYQNQHFFWCGWGDLNPHVLANTST